MSSYYKPFRYQWAYDLWKKHEAMHWMGQEVPMHEDVKDWVDVLNDRERALLTNLFRFFTQADIGIAEGYCKHFLPFFHKQPELAMMLSSFAAREAVHIDAYSLLIETIGMPETTYQDFNKYKEMREKDSFFNDLQSYNDFSTLRALGLYSGFGEGVQLFGSFALLLNFSRFNKMKGMGNIIAWSIRDEDLHVEGMTNLFKEKMKGHSLYAKGLEDSIKHGARGMVALEDGFIDLCFNGQTEILTLTPRDIKDYIRYLANKRWHQLGFDGRLYYEHYKNPLPWIDYIVNGVEHANFFEQKVTTYAKAMTGGSYADVNWELE